MQAAFFWGMLAGISLLAGAALVFAVPISQRQLGAIMAFGAGVLISAVSFELVEDAARATNGDWAVAAGMAAGALTFFAGDWTIDRAGGAQRKQFSGHDAGAANARAILLGTVLDGIPESIVIGVGLIGGGGASAAMIAAVFISNVPEAISATAGLRDSGWTRLRLTGMWATVALVAGIASLLGFVLLDGAADELVAAVEAFAAGALLTMLADSMMPEAFRLEGKAVGLLTTLGFGVAFAISALG